jgi:hypothetical protein
MEKSPCQNHIVFLSAGVRNFGTSVTLLREANLKVWLGTVLMTLLNAAFFARHMEVIPDTGCLVNVFCFVVVAVM